MAWSVFFTLKCCVPQAWGHHENSTDLHRTPEALHPLTQGTCTVHQLLGCANLPAPYWCAVPQLGSGSEKATHFFMVPICSKYGLQSLHWDMLGNLDQGWPRGSLPPWQGHCLPSYSHANPGHGWVLPCPTWDFAQHTHLTLCICTQAPTGNGCQLWSWVRAGRGMLGESHIAKGQEDGWLRTCPGEAGRWHEVERQHKSQGSKATGVYCIVPPDFT